MKKISVQKNKSL